MTLPPGVPLQSAAASYVDAVQFWAPDLAAEQALRLDPGFREEKLVQCFERWMQIDPAGARAWLADKELAEEVKQRCLAFGSTAPGQS